MHLDVHTCASRRRKATSFCGPREAMSLWVTVHREKNTRSCVYAEGRVDSVLLLYIVKWNSVSFRWVMHCKAKTFGELVGRRQRNACCEGLADQMWETRQFVSEWLQCMPFWITNNRTINITNSVLFFLRALHDNNRRQDILCSSRFFLETVKHWKHNSICSFQVGPGERSEKIDLVRGKEIS